jgi:hypothetical protein
MPLTSVEYETVISSLIKEIQKLRLITQTMNEVAQINKNVDEVDLGVLGKHGDNRTTSH